MNKYNTYEVYKCEECGAIIRIPPHNEKILSKDHVWKRFRSIEREEGKIKDPLKEAAV